MRVEQIQNRHAFRYSVVVLFSIAMAWMEAATVAYLRTLVHRVEPYQISPMPEISFLGMTEIVREAATLVMLAAAGWLAGKSWRSRFGYFIAAFGVWDIFYYVFLRIIVGWPHTLFDWDVLFLIPVPWWGPVLSPMLVSLVLILLGFILVRYDDGNRLGRLHTISWWIFGAGIALALYTFMENSFRIIAEGRNDPRTELPTTFGWPTFIVALLLMMAPFLGALLRSAGNIKRIDDVNNSK